jgi:hypothetical protein
VNFHIDIILFQQKFCATSKIISNNLKGWFMFDGYTNILIKVITMVSELLRNQIQLEFAVCNSHTRKMKSISGWKDKDLWKNLFVRRKYFWQKEFFNYLNSNLYYLICLSNNLFVLGHESYEKSWDFYRFLELSNFYFVVLSSLENIHIDYL